MGTDGGSEADTGRGTHRRRRLTHTLEHKPRAHNCSNYCKKKKFFLGFLAWCWLSWLAEGRGTGARAVVWVALAAGARTPLIAQ